MMMNGGLWTALHGWFRCSFLSMMMNGLWTLWAEGRAVDNGFIVIHGKRPGSPAGWAGELSTSPQPLLVMREVMVRTDGVFGSLLGQ